MKYTYMKYPSRILRRGLALAPMAIVAAGAVVGGSAEAGPPQLARGGVDAATGGVTLVQVPPGGKTVPKHQGAESYGGSQLPQPQGGAARPFQHNGVTTSYNKGVGEPKGGPKLPFDHNTTTSGAGNKKPR